MRNPIKNTKKLFVLVVVLFCATLASGCGQPPEKVVLKFRECLQNDDYEGAQNLSTDSFARKVNGFKSFAATLDSGTPDMSDYTSLAGDSDVNALIFDVNAMTGLTFASEAPFMYSYTEDQMESSISGGTARVWHKEEDYIVYILTKDGARWKMSGFDLSGLGDF